MIISQSKTKTRPKMNEICIIMWHYIITSIDTHINQGREGTHMMYEMNGKLLESSIDSSDLMSCSSKHGFIRTMERADMNDHQALRLIQNAWARGKRIDELPLTRQKKYVSHYESLLPDGYTNLRVYGGYLFIFSAGGRLITMHPLPKTFSKKRIYDGKTKVRDVRKYNRFNNREDCAADYELTA